MVLLNRSLSITGIGDSYFPEHRTAILYRVIILLPIGRVHSHIPGNSVLQEFLVVAQRLLRSFHVKHHTTGRRHDEALPIKKSHNAANPSHQVILLCIDTHLEALLAVGQ